MGRCAVPFLVSLHIFALTSLKLQRIPSKDSTIVSVSGSGVIHRNAPHVVPHFQRETERWLTPRTELSPLQRSRWQSRHMLDLQTLRVAALAGNCSTVLLGDSISEEWTRPFFNPFLPAEVAAATHCDGCGPAPKLRPGVLTFAIGGDSIQDLGWRLFEGGGIEALQECVPNEMILMIGTNDYGSGEDVKVAEQELRLLVRQLKEEIPETTRFVLNAILPRARRKGACADWDPLRHMQLNSALKAMEDETTTFLECGDILNPGVANAYQHDNLHLASKGYMLWEKCLNRVGVRLT